MSLFSPKDEPLGIYNVHLLSGEDVIGTLIESSERDCYVIKKPVLPNVAMDVQTQQFRVGLLPIRPYLGNVDEVEILAGNVLWKLPVSKQMEALYQQFTSNIVIASPGDVPNLDAPISSLIRT